MSRPLCIMVACGSGIATSSVAESAIREICEEMNVPIKLVKGTVSEVAEKSSDMDVVFVTNNYRQEVACPVVNVTGFITGINKNKTVEKVQNAILEISRKING